jgi:hypothetical protein
VHFRLPLIASFEGFLIFVGGVISCFSGFIILIVGIILAMLVKENPKVELSSTMNDEPVLGIQKTN